MPSSTAHAPSRPRPRGPRALRRTLALAACAALAGCVRPAGVVFEPTDGRYRWPPEPDEPRIRYIGQLASDADLKPRRGPGEGLGALLFGRPAARTMLSPMGVCTDGGDRVFVADSNAQVVHVFNLRTRRYQQWRPPEMEARFSQPVSVAYDPIGRLLVSDSVAGVLFIFDQAGEYVGTIGDRTLKRPCGVAVDAPRGRLLIADAAAHQVVVLTREDEELFRIGERGVGPGQFNYPTFVALDSAGRVYVSDSLNFRVQVFDLDYAPTRQIGRKGDMPGSFSQPKGLALDADDRLYVVDGNFEAIQVFDADGTLLMTFGGEGSDPGQFWLPAGIHVDAAGRIWVADSYNRRVQVFEPIAEAP